MAYSFQQHAGLYIMENTKCQDEVKLMQKINAHSSAPQTAHQ